MAYQNIQIVISPGQSFVTGQFVQVIHDINNYMFGQVLEYNSFTGYFLFTPVSIYGDGTYDSWTVVPAGSNGAATLYQGTSQTVIPVPSTTTTTTVYTPTYFYYNVIAYTCPGCLSGLSYIARSSVSRINNFFYNIGDGYVYQVQAEIAHDVYDIDLDGSAAATTCSSACSI
jgi:hypothetical protein